MIVLDCESRDSTLDSVSAIYGMSREEIEQFLQATDLDKHYATIDPVQPGHRELTLLFETEFGCCAAPLDRVFWFHLTRAQPNADFTNGIQPLDKALDRVWETIFTAFRNTHYEKNLQIMRTEGVRNFHYQLKVGNPVHGGPYAMLVRESAFRAEEMCNHNYLGLPEIIEDICNGYHEAYGEMIHDELHQHLTPYIVKFWSPKQTSKSCVESAMYYLYCTAHGEKLSTYANTCFDGENSPVPREQIVKIELLTGC